jgi:hypothetical protein
MMPHFFAWAKGPNMMDPSGRTCHEDDRPNMKTTCSQNVTLKHLLVSSKLVKYVNIMIRNFYI